jgi:RNA polymerase sigma-70 factor (ECF subfamily)
MRPPPASNDSADAPSAAAPEPSDEALMAALADGDLPALDVLMLRWQRPLQAFLYRHLANDADALDLAQETFVRLYRHRENYRPGARFTTWMFQIALNLARDHARKRERRRTDSLEAAPPAATAGLAAPGSAPDTAARRSEEIAAVRAAIASLPEDLREVLILFEYEDRSHAEIAGIIGATPKAVEARLYRARDKLRASLARWLKS